LESLGSDEETAVGRLGANGWDVFCRVTLPTINWGLLYGMILCNARAMSEFACSQPRVRPFLLRAVTEVVGSKACLSVTGRGGSYEAAGAASGAQFSTTREIRYLLARRAL
jgi:ABC-type sulfate transport system permease subunit